jgi:pimeloyl-ACP methyl ester carboxylesterase
VTTTRADIVLVHGAYHGPWCWDRLRPYLERSGHRVIAADLPISDPAAGLGDYADAVVESMARDTPAVVVGHSMGGLVIPLVAARRPVQRLVFLAALVPEPGRSANDQRRAEPIEAYSPTTAEWTDLGDTVWAIGPNTATEIFFHDLPSESAAWAATRLRPQAYGVFDEQCPLEDWPDVPASYVVCRDDRAVSPDWGRDVARRRLGTDPIELDGGHSPFLGRPSELAQRLTLLALPG